MTIDLDLDALLVARRRAAAAGGAIVRRRLRRRAATCATKAPGDWVSDADTASEHAVRELLARRRARARRSSARRAGASAPTSAGSSTRSTAPRTSCTASRCVGVSVGLVADGRPVVGVVHAPLLGRDVLRARRGAVARRDDGRSASATATPSEAICATGFPFRRKRPPAASTSRCSSAALARFEDLRRAGAASLDLAWTAAGVFDGYFEQALGPWDVAAGAPARAGGRGSGHRLAGRRPGLARLRRHRRRPARRPRSGSSR